MLMLTLNVIYVLVAIAIIAMVLMQRGSGAAAGSGFGSGASGTVFGARGASNFLSKSTKWLAIAFFGISLFMAWYASHSARPVTQQSLGVMAEQAAPAQGGLAPGEMPVPPPAPAATEVPAAAPVAPPVESAPADAGTVPAPQPEAAPPAQ